MGIRVYFLVKTGYGGLLPTLNEEDVMKLEKIIDAKGELTGNTHKGGGHYDPAQDATAAKPQALTPFN